MKAICQLCAETYAEVSAKTLRYPLTGAMFGSPDKPHGYPDPFDPLLTFEHMMCPMGRTHRPMVSDDEILTDEGLLQLPHDGGPPVFVEAPAEIDRSSISDRTVQVSDEEAERRVREKMAEPDPGHNVPVPEELLRHSLDKAYYPPKRIMESLEKAYPAGEMKDLPGTKDNPIKIPGGDNEPFKCPECGKSFPDERKMKGHIGGAHRKGKKAK